MAVVDCIHLTSRTSACISINFGDEMFEVFTALFYVDILKYNNSGSGDPRGPRGFQGEGSLGAFIE